MALVSTAWLAEHLDDPDIVVADVRWYLSGRRGIDEYRRGHIPGAFFVDLERELCGPSGPGRHPLPTPQGFAALLSRLGVSPSTRVVAYDDAGGAIAARLWWLLRYFRHEGALVLDGGIDGWRAEGRPLSTVVPPDRGAATLALSPSAELVVDAARVAELLSEAGSVVIDARAPERFTGREEPVDPRPGHIPDARNVPFSDNLEQGRFRAVGALRERYARVGAINAQTVVVYCGSGVTACHDLLALSLLGRNDALLYEGSWSDWSSDPKRPAALGEESVDA